MEKRIQATVRGVEVVAVVRLEAETGPFTAMTVCPIMECQVPLMAHDPHTSEGAALNLGALIEGHFGQSHTKRIDRSIVE